MSKLRQAVEFITTLSCRATVKEVARIAGVDERAAGRYVGQLVNQGVLNRDESTYQIWPGPTAEEWRKKPPKTKPGGNSREYQEARRLREELRQRDWQWSRAQIDPDVGGGPMGGELSNNDANSAENEQTGESGTDWGRTGKMATMAERVRRQIQPVVVGGTSYATVRDLATVLRVTERTAKRYVQVGIVQSVRIGGCRRIPTVELERLLQMDGIA